jgi:hypothetical protein
MSLAMHNMNDTYGLLPPMVGYYPQSSNGGNGQANTPGNTRGTCFYWLLPFIEQDNAQKAMAANHPDSWWCGIGIKTYLNPADPSEPPTGMVDTGSPRFAAGYAPNEYVFNSGSSYAITGNRVSIGQTIGTARIPATFIDGTSNTILFAEKYAVCGNSSSNASDFYWGETGGNCNRGGGVGSGGSTPGFYPQNATPQNKPIPFACNPCLLQGTQSAGILVGLGDGSTRLVSSAVSLTTWQRAVLPNDGLTLGSDW